MIQNKIYCKQQVKVNAMLTFPVKDMDLNPVPKLEEYLI